MLKIDVQKMLNEKRAKELKTSLNELVASVFQTFEDKVFSDLCSGAENPEHRFEIEFDNGSTFYIGVACNHGTMVRDYGYIDDFGNYKDVLNLQEALNVNKYSRDIEYDLRRYAENKLITLEGYFTMQNIDKKLPIFHESSVAERHLTNKQSVQYIQVKNVDVRDLER